MAILYGNSLNLGKNELQNARIQNLGSDPSSPVVGQTYFNTGTNKLRTYNGSTWDEYGTSTATGDVSQSSNSSGSGLLKISSGANKIITDYAATGLVKTASGVASAAVVGTDYSVGTGSLGTGILKSTTTTGALSIAVAGDFPTLNQSTTGSAATLTTSRSIYGNAFNGSADITAIIAATYGGTANAFFSVSGPASTIKTYTFPNSNSTMAALGTAQSWTATQTFGSGNLILSGSTSGTTILNATAIAGSTTLTLPAATDTLVGKATTDAFTNKTFDANGTGNSISNIEVADFASNVVDTDGTLAANSATRIPSQSAVVTYVQANIQGVKWKAAVRAATSAAGTLATSFENGDVIDGVTLATGDRILLKDQAAGAENGIYTVNASGAPTRATDADTATEIKNAVVTVSEGTANADTAWQLITDSAITLNTTALVFTNFVSANVPTATTSLQGKVQLATQAEAQAKTDTAKALTAASVADFTRKYTGLIGDNSSTAIAVTHGLGSQYVTAQVFDASTNAMIIVDTTLTSSTVTTFTFATAPATNAYRVVIIG